MAGLTESDIGDKILGGNYLTTDEMLASTGVNHLQWVAKLCGCNAANHGAWANDNFAKAFANSGVTTFEDLILLASDDLNNLTYAGVDPAGNRAMVKLPPVKIVLLRFYLHLYHRESRLDKDKAHPMIIDQEAMLSVRTKSEVNPHAEILPWYAPDKASADMKRDWMRSVKRDAKQFPIFRKDHMFLMFKEGFIDCAKAQGVYDLLEPTPEEEKFYQMHPNILATKNAWFYNVLLGHALNTTALLEIVKSHRVTKDCRTVWNKLCAKLENSITAEATASALANYLQSATFATQVWKGTLASQLNFWKEKHRQYQEIIPINERYQAAQSVRLLKLACTGHPVLEQVYITYKTNTRALRHTQLLDFDAYYSLLVDAAQTKDNGKSTNTRRKALMHLIADGNEEVNGNAEEQYNLLANIQERL